jgi:hypothetical protein
MRIKTIILCLLVTGMILSCQKEELANDIKGLNSKVPLLSKVLVDNQLLYEYSYNDSSLITEDRSKFDLTMHHYNGKGLLASTKFYGIDDILSSDAQIFQAAMNSKVWVTAENGVKGGSMTYEYNEFGQLIKTSYFWPLSTISEYSVFSYDSNNKISRQTMYWGTMPTGYINYSYDGKGNLIKEMLYNLPSDGAAELITTTQYDFDNEQNPYRLSGKMMIPGIITNKNNIIKETNTIHLAAAQGPDKVKVTTNTYVYNGLGYPVSKNGNVTYIYK